MPVYQLSEKLIFPHPKLAEDGVLAIGGDLSPERLILAYQNGIFPWYNENEPIIWHAPNPRFVLFPEKFKKSDSLKQLIKKQLYTCTFNMQFEDVMRNCKTIKRKNEDGTWISNEIIEAYYRLFQYGFAQSVEVKNNEGKLVGGLYGVTIGKVFFGESMFSIEPNTSKLALAWLIENSDYKLVDTQVYTNHLNSLGAEFISLKKFLLLLQKYIYE
jgi:leucyl/phenylalanyl-tRNA--protein transferase